MTAEKRNIVWHRTKVTQKDRESLIGQRGLVILLTGLSGSGKSTIASGTEKLLFNNKKLTYILDGDNIRHGINADLGFSNEDRQENMRRIGEVANLFSQSGVITLLSFIAPFEEDRKKLKTLIGDRFIEVHIDCDVETCINRDPKGLYKKAINREIDNFTGLSSSYEKPNEPDLVLNTDELTEDEAIEKLFTHIMERQKRGDI